MQEVYPESSGQIYCMEQEQFNKFYKDLENGLDLSPQFNPAPGA
jgi:hypothetical protein